MKSTFLATLIVSAIASTSTLAATVYDESIDGDASAFVGVSPDLGTLALGTSSIFGAYDAGGPGFDAEDEQDTYLFTATDTFTIDAFTLFGDSALYDLQVQGPFEPLVTPSAAAEDMFGAFAAGSYALYIIGDRNAGSGGYRVDINVGPAAVVPVPAAGLLLLTALGAMGVARRRSRT